MTRIPEGHTGRTKIENPSDYKAPQVPTGGSPAEPRVTALAAQLLDAHADSPAPADPREWRVWLAELVERAYWEGRAHSAAGDASRK